MTNKQINCNLDESLDSNFTAIEISWRKKIIWIQ